MKIKLLSILCLNLLFLSCNTSEKKTSSVLERVNPFIGTDGHGHTYPGASVPFGMVQLSPDTDLKGWDHCSGYHYSDSTIIGFSHTHLSGTGRSDLMDVMLMPYNGNIQFQAGTTSHPESGYRSRFSHSDEVASPNFYSVLLKDYNIRVDLTATKRCGMHRYIFPESKESHVILDLTHHFETDSIVSSTLQVVDNHTLIGECKSVGWGEAGEKYYCNQQVYFVVEFSKPFSSSILAVNNLQTDARRGIGKDVKVVCNYETKSADTLLVKVGISSVSIENARENLKAEIPNWDFDEILSAGRELWIQALANVQIEASPQEREIFYTSLYHSMLAPNLFEDVDGEYRGFDGKIHNSDNFTNYTTMSLWDTFRAENTLLSLLNPQLTNDIISSMLAQYDQTGLLPVWPLWSSETNCMIGVHSIPVIVDAYFKGIRNFDIKKVYSAMKHSAMQDGFGLKELKQYGYIPYDKYNRSVSTGLEYCFDDWCMARIAKALGQTDDAKYFLERSASYRKYFDSEYNLMNGLSSTGTFRRPFNPLYSSYGECDWVEGNAWQYSFFVPHDIPGLIELYGGKDHFENALDSLFKINNRVEGDAPVDISGLIGQYAHGNEPSHHVAYLYDYVGKYAKTQKRVLQIMNQFYSTKPDGLCGNEDCGQMSAWYVFSALGFYPVNPASGIYALGVPAINSAKMKIGNGVFEIIAHRKSRDSKYVQKVKLNGKILDKPFITDKDLMAGGRLEFYMGSTPQNLK